MEKEENSITFIDFIALILRYRIMIIAVTLIGTIAFGCYSYKKYTANQKEVNVVAVPSAEKYKVTYILAISNKEGKTENGDVALQLYAYTRNSNNINDVLKNYPTLFNFDIYRSAYKDLDEETFRSIVTEKYFLPNFEAGGKSYLQMNLITKDYINGSAFLKEMGDKCIEFINRVYRSDNYVHLDPVSSSPQVTVYTPKETTVAPKETTVAPKETTVAPKETTVAPKETTVAQLVKEIIVGFVVSFVISIVIALIADCIRLTKSDPKAIEKLSRARHNK